MTKIQQEKQRHLSSPRAVAPSPIPTPLLPAGLLLLFPGALGAEGAVHRAAVGSSVLLPGLAEAAHSNSMRWEFLTGSGPQTILQHNGGAQAPNIHPPFAGRATFHPSNGSLLLEDVQESDSGTYRVTVNTGGRKSLEIQLEVLRECREWEGGVMEPGRICLYMDQEPGQGGWRRDLGKG